ncbi:MAG: LCP family protein [Aeromicrobium sp.]
MPRPTRPPSYTDGGKRREGGTPFHQRHRKIIVALVSVVLVVGLAGSGYAYMLNSKFGNIEKVNVNLKEKNRPDPDKGKALNIMLLGSDKGKNLGKATDDTTLSQDAKAKKWPSGKYRSDTLMVVHISADRKHVYLVSIPRDSFLTIYDGNGNPTHKEKVNAAFSYFGPTGAIATVENLSDLRMKHLAIIDWDGFEDMTNAVGGVPVFIPDTFTDPKQNKTWNQGEQDLKGKEALQYVRTRYGLINGDFDRIARQQNFLRALMKKILSGGTMKNPVRLSSTLEAITKHLTVDSAWRPGDMRALALSLRGTAADDVTFMTLPVAGTSTDPTYGSIVNVDEVKSKELFAALKTDTVDDYLEKYPDAALKPPKDVQ